MHLFFVFARNYPISSALMVLGLIFAALAEGVGIGAMLPLFALVLRQQSGTDAAELGGETDIERRVADLFTSMGIEVTLANLAIVLLSTLILKAGLVIAAKRQVGYTVAQSATDLRLRFLKALMSARWRYFVDQRMGIMTNAFSTESERSATAYLYATTVLSLLINSFFYTVIAFLISWEAMVAAFVSSVIGMVLLAPLVRATRKAGNKQTVLMRNLINRLSDTLQALKPVKAMSRENQIAPLLSEDTAKLNRALQRKVLATEALAAVQEPIIATCLVFVFGFCMVYLALPPSRLLVLGFIFVRLLTQLARAQRQYQNLTTQESAYWAIEKTIAQTLVEREVDTGEQAPVLEQQISLDAISLQYGDHVVFDEASLEIPAGEITALVGPSGSGKTTLSDLVIGLVEADSGTVAIDGVPLDQVSKRAWRERIGYVPQEMFLINDTIRVNVTLGEDGLGDAEVEAALRAAGAWEFILKLPDGVDTRVGERGAMISGGQRQRIAIARALIHKPALLVLDEATTALDPVTEASLWKTMLELRGTVTILAVSHQTQLANIADRIYRVENGKALSAAV
ncbi:MAG: ABC transporter ATP-binding protein/permease [Myxococcota bacterium]|nr:ABC transporter ATP-binding protein/permease [Myxococcota bacterium]